MIKTINDINLNQLFVKRELPFVPKHFVRANTPLTIESKQWVLDKLIGRFAIVHKPDATFHSFTSPTIAFEDPEESIFYELKWS